jgi:hypothetical protein
MSRSQCRVRESFLLIEMIGCMLQPFALEQERDLPNVRRLVNERGKQRTAGGGPATVTAIQDVGCNGSRSITPVEVDFVTLIAGFGRAVLPFPHPLKAVLAVKGSLRRAPARP